MTPNRMTRKANSHHAGAPFNRETGSIWPELPAQSMRIRDELDPVGIVGSVQVLVYPVIPADHRLARLRQKHHPRLFRHAAAFAMVARLTGAHQILPAMRTAAMARNYVVDRQFFSLFAAVLTSVVVAHEQLAPRQFGNRVHPFDHVKQANDGRTGVFPGRRVQHQRAELDDFRLAVSYQDKGPPDRTDVQRFEVLIEDKNAAIHRIDPIYDKCRRLAGREGRRHYIARYCSNVSSRRQRREPATNRRQALCNEGESHDSVEEEDRAGNVQRLVQSRDFQIPRTLGRTPLASPLYKVCPIFVYSLNNAQYPATYDG